MPWLSFVLLVGLLLSRPAAAYAQAAIAGAVRSATGEPIRGVVVEAASASIIEETRTAVTDGAGRYRIEGLRPGVYMVTFTIAGWKSERRDDIVLTGSFTATLDAQLSVGTATETISVTGESLIVDVQNAGRELTLSGETVKRLPTAPSYSALLVLVPGVVTNTNDIVTGTATTSCPSPGGRTNEGRLVMNVVGKSGGNVHHGSFFVSGSSAHFQSDNHARHRQLQGSDPADGCGVRADRPGPHRRQGDARQVPRRRGDHRQLREH
jgi:hypothetical protein